MIIDGWRGGYREGRQGVQRVHLKHENVDRDPDPAQVRVMQQNVESYQRPCYYTICVTLTPACSYEIMGIQNSNLHAIPTTMTLRNWESGEMLRLFSFFE